MFDIRPAQRPDAFGPCFLHGSVRLVVGKWSISGGATGWSA